MIQKERNFKGTSKRQEVRPAGDLSSLATMDLKTVVQRPSDFCVEIDVNLECHTQSNK